jgi:predicted regulator of Ras-like GTPase activity (Roadblock/LC7/MglB family)
VRSFLNSVTGVRKNLIIEGNVRNVAWQDPTEATAAFAVFAAVMGDADYPAKALSTGQLPT